MKILQQYIISIFVRFFLSGLIFFTGIILITDVFEVIPLLSEKKIPILTTMAYFGCKIPFVVFLITPVAVLLATISCFSLLLRNSEITAMKASGVSIYKIISPVLTTAFFISILAMGVNEFLVPFSNTKAEYTKMIKIEGRQEDKNSYNASFRTTGNRFLNIGRINEDGTRMEAVEIKDYQADNSISMRIDAQTAKWIDNQWWLFNGIERRFLSPLSEGRAISEQRFNKKKLDILETPDEIQDIIAAGKVRAEKMSMVDLWRNITLLKRSGNGIEDKLVDFYLKTSFPFASLIIALLGTSIALQSTRGAIAAGFGISIMVSFVYWESIGIGRSLGHEGVLPAILAAWLANIIFGVVGVFLLFRAKG
ncbi:LptF/LptG family permease [bacterium]|nr:LptF/LptG family permease [bacterium]MBU1753243.1 LptF/LptG family permease [bacterium]